MSEINDKNTAPQHISTYTIVKDTWSHMEMTEYCSSEHLNTISDKYVVE